MLHDLYPDEAERAGVYVPFPELRERKCGIIDP
jgi:hypothetical protein